MKLGSLVSVGRTSDVFEFGREAVVKVPREGVPAHWVGIEAALTTAIHDFGLPSPAVLDVVVIDGRQSLVLSRIDGPSMWELMLERPGEVPSLVDRLVAVQRQIHAAGLPPGLPDLTARLIGKVRECDQIDAGARREAERIVAGLPSGAAVLHGDLHPGNILMSPSGPIVIDWFDTSIGHPLADVVRSSLLMRPGFAPGDREHLPGASDDTLDLMHRAYLAAWRNTLERAGIDLRRWEAVIGVARMVEGADADPAPLHALWEQRTAGGRSSLLC